MTLTRLLIPLVLTLISVALVDHLLERNRLQPPGFSNLMRRALAFIVLAGILFAAVFAPLGLWGLEVEPDLSQVSIFDLFSLHLVLLGSLGTWFALGWAGVETPSVPLGRRALGSVFARQFGLRAPSFLQELKLGLLGGILAWPLVVGTVLVVALLMVALGGAAFIPENPPEMILWIVSLHWGLRIVLSLSAGIVEELFFRGFLQPRIGVGLSTAFFVLAHFAYGSPLLLVGVTVLSLYFAFLVRWRQNIWAAVVAHALFDAIQLLVVIPKVLA